MSTQAPSRSEVMMLLASAAASYVTYTSFSANELSNRDITVQRRASGVASTHLQHLDRMNNSVKEALTNTVTKSETAGVAIEDRDNVALGAKIENPRVSNVLRQEGPMGQKEVLRQTSGLTSSALSGLNMLQVLQTPEGNLNNEREGEGGAVIAVSQSEK